MMKLRRQYRRRRIRFKCTKGIAIDDPVRMYLKEIEKQLLSSEEEIIEMLK